MTFLKRIWCKLFHKMYHAWYVGKNDELYADCHLCGEDRIKTDKRYMK